MENTGKLLFSETEDQAVWFVALDPQKWVGPLSGTEVVQRIQSGELTWAHFGWRKEQAGWMRLCDIPLFKGAVPMAPSEKLQPKLDSQGQSKSAPPPVPRSVQWFLYYSDSQFGPFSEEELHRFLRIGKIHGEVHAWSEGMTGWQKLKTLPEFTESVEESRKVRSGGAVATPAATPKNESKAEDRRKSPRVPLIARSMMAANGKVFSGMCRDVSVGGMQLLTSEVPGPIGTRIKLNISTPNGSENTIHPFVAEAIVVRVLEDGKGFSFRFEKLSNEGQKAIEAYVAQQA